MWPFKKREKAYCAECKYYNEGEYFKHTTYSFHIFEYTLEPELVKQEVCLHPDNIDRKPYTKYNGYNRCSKCNPRGNCKKWEKLDEN